MSILDHAPFEPPVNLPGGNPKQPPKPSSVAVVPPPDFRAGALAEQRHQLFDPSEPPLCCAYCAPVPSEQVTS